MSDHLLVSVSRPRYSYMLEDALQILREILTLKRIFTGRDLYIHLDRYKIDYLGDIKWKYKTRPSP